MNHRQLPSARRLKGFLSERLSPVIEYLMVWHHFLLIQDEGIEIGSALGLIPSRGKNASTCIADFLINRYW
jgi:hypothetical protein